MTESQTANQRVFIAIDIAKKNHDALICWPSGKSKYVRIPNTMAGYHELMDIAGVESDKIIIAFKPTADYHRNIAYCMRSFGVDCQLVSSLSSARAREMLYGSWDKHDRKDARVIMYLMQQGMMRPFYDPLVEKTMDEQEICNVYHQISLARPRCQHSICNHYLTLYFPEFERYFYASRAERFCRFLLKFSTPL